MVMNMLKNLKALRNAAGISQKQLADIIMVSQQSINKYENHGVEPDINTLIKIADYFNVSIDYLVGRVEIKQLANRIKTSDLNDSELELIYSFRSLKETQKSCILHLMQSFHK